jgi:WhiB family transcriptional regulator, redox-sensing transcriptional regulator
MPRPPRKPILTDRSWVDHANCVGKTELFFPALGERPERRERREAEARTLCHACPVMLACRADARLNRESGFWGGESEEERAAAGYAPYSTTRRAVRAAASGG